MTNPSTETATTAESSPPTEAAAQTALKVILPNHLSPYASFDYAPFIPKDGEPGPWLPPVPNPSACTRGYHVTDREWACAWWQEGALLFEVEVRGEHSRDSQPDKTAWSEMRLLRQAEWAEAAQYFTEGQHQLKAGAARAFGSATVEAFGSATVRASDSATVEAFGSATVRASDSATVRAFDSATVRASDSATVEAFDSATVRAFGSATVRASDSATVRAFGSATVEAFDSATVRASDSATVEASGSATVRAFDSATVRAFDSATVRASDSATVEAFGSATVESSRYHSPSAVVALAALAAHIDRRDGKLVLRTARGAGATHEEVEAVQ